MSSVRQNYFTCTLGEAAERKEKAGDRSFKTILRLIDEQAEQRPDLPALGFADFLSDSDGPGMSH